MDLMKVEGKKKIKSLSHISSSTHSFIVCMLVFQKQQKMFTSLFILLFLFLFIFFSGNGKDNPKIPILGCRFRTTWKIKQMWLNCCQYVILFLRRALHLYIQIAFWGSSNSFRITISLKKNAFPIRVEELCDENLILCGISYLSNTLHFLWFWTPSFFFTS